MKNKRLVVFALLVSFTLFGCTKSEPVNQETNINNEQESEATATSTEELNIGIRYITTLNPIENSEESVADMLKLVYMPLVSVDKDERIKPGIAKSFTFSPDGKTVTLDISGTTFHDGSSVTSDDVLYTVSEIRSAPEES